MTAGTAVTKPILLLLTVWNKKLERFAMTGTFHSLGYHWTCLNMLGTRKTV